MQIAREVRCPLSGLHLLLTAEEDTALRSLCSGHYRNGTDKLKIMQFAAFVAMGPATKSVELTTH